MKNNLNTENREHSFNNRGKEKLILWSIFPVSRVSG